MVRNKRTTISLILATLLIGGAWFFTSSTAGRGQVSGAEKVNLAVSETDTDGDGLKDWEERLWKTDLNNKDTDNDGTSDGEEVILRRDPNVAAPNDSIDETILAKNDTIKEIADNDDLNLSESFGRSVFATYLKNNIGSQTQDQVEALELMLAKKIPESRDYVTSDLSIGTATTKEAYIAYGNAFALALISGSVEGEGELAIFARALEKNDREELKKLDPIILNIEERIKNLKAVTVPFTASDAHLSLLNSLEAARYDIQGMKMVFDDSMLAFLALNSYRTTSTKVLSDIQAIKGIVKANGATFSAAEVGYKIFGQ